MQKEDKTAEEWKKQGDSQCQNQNYGSAISCYSKAIRLNPLDIRYYSNRSICFYHLHQFCQCVKDCDHCLQINPNFTKSLRRKGLASLQLLEFDQAINCYKAAFQIENKMPFKQEYLEALNLREKYQSYVDAVVQHQIDEALTYVTQLIDRIPFSLTLKYNKVECLAKLAQLTEALYQLQSIPELTQNENQNEEQTPQSCYLKGLIELYSGQITQAKEFLRKGLKLLPHHLECKETLKRIVNTQDLKYQANELMKAGKFFQAEGIYTQALNVDPFNNQMNAIILSNRGLCFMKEKEPVKALDDLNRSIQLDPQYIKSLARRAEVHMETERYSQAIKDFQRIEELDSKINLKNRIKKAQKKESQLAIKCYLATLKLQKAQSPEEIRSSYKELAFLYHPDHNKDKSEHQQKQIQMKFRDVSQAYEMLTEPSQRQDRVSVRHSSAGNINLTSSGTNIFQLYTKVFRDLDLKEGNNKENLVVHCGKNSSKKEQDPGLRF